MANNSIWQVMKSVAAGFFGVQSNENRVKDFNGNSILPYILVGCIFTIIFILILVSVVSYVTS